MGCATSTGNDNLQPSLNGRAGIFSEFLWCAMRGHNFAFMRHTKLTESGCRTLKRFPV
jgi:hypothetical protein